MAINMAGAQASDEVIFVTVTKILQALLPAIEAAGKAEAKATYAGKYTAGAGNSITLSVHDGPGLRATNFKIRGKDIIKGYSAFNPYGGGSDSPPPEVRLYPTNLKAGNQTSWRAVYDTTPISEVAAYNAQLFFVQGSCLTWTGVDEVFYGEVGLDDFVFELDDQGSASCVTARAWRETMTKED